MVNNNDKDKTTPPPEKTPCSLFDEFKKILYFFITIYAMYLSISFHGGFDKDFLAACCCPIIYLIYYFAKLRNSAPIEKNSSSE